METFQDRRDAGRRLALRLQHYANAAQSIVLGIPRGGVIVAAEIAQSLHLPLDIFLSQKLGVPAHEELAFGAITSGGCFLNEQVVREAGISPETVSRVSSAAQDKLKARMLLYRRDRPPLMIQNQAVILVDDGVATGASIFAAIRALRLMSPQKLVVAAPVAPRPVCDRLRAQVDELVVLACPRDFFAVGEFYDQFAQVADEEVLAALDA